MASGVLGDLLEVEMHYDYYRPEVPTQQVPEFSVAWSFLYGHGVHIVDQVLNWFGHPDEVRYDGSSRLDNVRWPLPGLRPCPGLPCFTVAFTVALSVLVHASTAAPILRKIDRRMGRSTPEPV